MNGDTDGRKNRWILQLPFIEHLLCAGYCISLLSVSHNSLQGQLLYSHFIVSQVPHLNAHTESEALAFEPRKEHLQSCVPPTLPLSSARPELSSVTV